MIGGSVDTQFERLLTGFSWPSIEGHRDAVFGIWPDFRIGFYNAAWVRFAEANGGEPNISKQWPIGADFLSAISSELRGFYRGNFERCLSEMRPWEHLYECSSG